LSFFFLAVLAALADSTNLDVWHSSHLFFLPNFGNSLPQSAHANVFCFGWIAFSAQGEHRFWTAQSATNPAPQSQHVFSDFACT
jgi:hypothetical protein